MKYEKKILPNFLMQQQSKKESRLPCSLILLMITNLLATNLPSIFGGNIKHQ
jgi:hypothetical protein